ncbi:hypothetical protein BH11PSE3_BH11PSE3_12070 [soil metagenome]
MADSDDLFARQMLALGYTPPHRPIERPPPAALEAADRVSRHWTSRHAGKLQPGSEAHKREVCRMFQETFNPYRPSIIAWPVLGADALQRVTSLPIWDIAVHTEGRARLRFAAYAACVEDPEIRASVMLNAWEENRHKEVLASLVASYGIALASEPAYQYPRDPEWTYLVTGYCECIDSFFAFGLFELARRSGFFPAELVETFEPVIQEECRHILLFANLVAWKRANMPWWRRLHFEFRVTAAWFAIAWERLVLARTMGASGVGQDSNFTASSAQAVTPIEIGVRDLMELCLQENDRRFAGYDPRLVRPTAVPKLARLALLLSRPWTNRKRRAAVPPESGEVSRGEASV